MLVKSPQGPHDQSISQNSKIQSGQPPGIIPSFLGKIVELLSESTSGIVGAFTLLCLHTIMKYFYCFGYAQFFWPMTFDQLWPWVVRLQRLT